MKDEGGRMKASLFANPISGRGEGVAIAGSISSYLSSRDWSCHLSLEHPDSLADNALAERIDAAIIVGGDGTLRTVLNRLRKTLDPLPPVLFVPLGTANLMSRHLGLRWNAQTFSEQAYRLLCNRNLRQIDAAVCNDQLFLLMTTVGIDAEVVHQLGKARKGPIKKTSYIPPAWGALWSFRQPPMTVEVDGYRVVENQRVFTFVANVREYGIGIPIANEAVSDDGLLDICIFPADNQLNLLQMSLSAVVTLPTLFPGSMYLRGREIRIESKEPAPVQIDGDPAGFTPLKIGLLPFKVPFIVP